MFTSLNNVFSISRYSFCDISFDWISNVFKDVSENFGDSIFRIETMFFRNDGN